MMKSIHLHRQYFIAVFCTLFLGVQLSAQIEVEPTGTIFTPENLITNVFLGDGVEVTNLSYQGDNLAVGYFTNGMDDVGMDRGIVMSSGFATTAATANNGGGTTGNTDGAMPVDPDIAAITTAAPNDVAIYEISFIPINDTLRFKYSWASEEYPEYACSGFNDAFGFFISGPGITGPFTNNGLNIAFIPDPTDPSGTTFTDLPVTINNVNSGTVGTNGTLANCTPPNGTLDYGMYYNDNLGSTTLTYDGILDVFIAQAVVIPCQEYTIKLAVCDAGDSAFDSAVFLEAKSFGTGSLEVDITTVSLDGTLAEGCSDGLLSFSLPNEVENDLAIDYTIFGTAENGVDYQFIPEDLFIAAGDSSVSVPVIVFEDGVMEGIESIGIDVQRDPCTRDTFYFYIKDNEIVPPVLGNDTTICRLESVQLDGTLDIPLPDPPTFTNTQDFPIIEINPNNPPPPGTPLTTSEIDVFAVQPAVLQEGVIKRVCINVAHPWISDVDAYLVSPGGQFLELTTDNGGSGNNYTETCFTPISTEDIDFGSQAPPSEAPFTGDWRPEGIFEDLWDGENPTNGTWQLQLKDDAAEPSGTLLDWSICFNPLYQVNYSWSPSAGLSCDDCPDPIATPDTTTTYVLTAMDTYGCEVYDSITITVLDVLPPPVLSCEETTSSINFTWEELTDADGYEVSVDGGPWMAPVPGPLNHFIDGLPLNTEVTIAVRGTALCNGEVDSVTCMTLDCTPPDFVLDNVTALDCNGDTDGTISVTATGMFPPYTYMIANVDTNSTGVFTGLAGGLYTVMVTDIGDCTAFLNIEVVEPPAIQSAPIIITNVLCNGNGEGEGTFDVSGGAAPYTFNWSNGSSDSIAINLPIGEYIATITDAQGCAIIDTLDISQPTEIVLSQTTEAVSCNGNGDGTATVILQGGTMPYTYQWDNNAADQTTATATALSGGSYSVTVTDAQGCTGEIIALVNENTAVTVNLDGTAALCNDSADGTATVIASGGTGGTYTYQWDDPLSQTTATATGLTQNTYNVVATDSAGCTASGSFEILAPPALVTSNITATDATCNNASDGVITIGASGGTYPYTFEWSDNGLVTDSTRTDLLAGDYQIVVTDNNGCSETLDISISEPAAIQLSIDIVDVACNGGDTGTATLNAVGGTEPYSYLWDASANNQTTQQATGLSTGTYSVTITDANGCTNVASEIVAEASDISLSLTQNDVLCFGNSTGDIDLSIGGGTEPYNITWSGPNSFTANAEDINNLMAGNYVAIVTDAAGCTATTSADITQPSTGIMSTMSPDDEICNGATDGTATVSVGGGTGPFTYVWDNGITTATVNNLTGGTHFVTITDSGNCTYVDTIFVAEREQLSVTLSQEGSFCFNGNDGTATVENIMYGNTPANIADFTLTWSDGQSTATASGLIGGNTYNIIVTDNLGCTASATIEIDNPAEIGSFTQEENSTSCFGGADGSATVGGNGGTAPYTFLWDVNAGSQTTATAIDLEPGNYSVTITDDNGCATARTVTIEQPDPISLTLNPVNVACPGQSNGSINTTILGGTPNYTYEWSNGDTTSALVEIATGDYSLIVTDINGCTNEANTTIGAPPIILATVESEPVTCFDDEDGQIIISAEGGTPPFRYSIDDEEYSATYHYIGVDAGTYSAYVLDANGCKVKTEIVVAEPPAINLYVGEDQTFEVGSDNFPYQLNSFVENNQGDFTVTWIPPYDGSLYCNEVNDNVICRRPWVDIDYTATFEAVVVDENGCEDSDAIIITVSKFRPVSVPTGFTPNNDNTNDKLLVHGVEGTVVKLFRIYDRWGEMLFQTSDFDVNDPDVGWDGTFKGKEVNPGVYVWYVEVEHIDGVKEALQGNTTLIR